MKRLDIAICELGLVPSRSKAAELIKAGRVVVDGRVVTKPSADVLENSKVEVQQDLLKYVSRGGFKLEKAIDEFKLDFAGKTVLDMGSSTGGFTDCALQNGAEKVYAVDVGSNQLAEKLKKDKRVVSKENTDVRDLSTEVFNKVQYIVADISFISEVKILSAIVGKISSQELIILIKPQFECGIELAKKHKGIIRDYNLSKEIATKAIEKIKALGFKVLGLTDSPITGGDGNHEFIVHLKK